MKTDVLLDVDGVGQAELIRTGEITAADLVEAAIERIDAINPQLNAVVSKDYDRARAQAQRPLPDSALAGVPYLVKDTISLEGTKNAAGSVLLKDFVAPTSHTVIARSEAAGLMMLGHTNACEFGLLPATEPTIHGPCNNPWNQEYSPGGSSGGAATAVASGMVPLANATDGGGSIRVPASNCGVFGLKVSRGRNPQAPNPDLHGLSVMHCVSRAVRDSAALLDITRGVTDGDRFRARDPEQPYLAQLDEAPRKLRIGFTAQNYDGETVHPDCVAAVQQTAKLCESLGHTVEEVSLDVNGERMRASFMVFWSAMPGDLIRGFEAGFGGPLPREALETWTWSLNEKQAELEACDVFFAERYFQELRNYFVEWHKTYDVLLTPVLGQPPEKTGVYNGMRTYDELYEVASKYVGFTPLANATGQPAMSVPLYWNADGLPIGSHFTGNFSDESTLFRLAAELEEASPWAERYTQLALT